MKNPSFLGQKVELLIGILKIFTSFERINYVPVQSSYLILDDKHPQNLEIEQWLEDAYMDVTKPINYLACNHKTLPIFSEEHAVAVAKKFE